MLSVSLMSIAVVLLQTTDLTRVSEERRRCAPRGCTTSGISTASVWVVTPKRAKMSVHYLGIFSIIFFYLLILGVGMWAARKSKGGSSDSEEVMLAGRNIGLLVGVFTMTGSHCLYRALALRLLSIPPPALLLSLLITSASVRSSRACCEPLNTFEAQGRSYVEELGCNCLLVIWPMILRVTRSHKRTKDVVDYTRFPQPKYVWRPGSARTCWGKFSAPQTPYPQSGEEFYF